MLEPLTLTAPISLALSAPEIRVFAPTLERLARLWPTIEPILKRATDCTRGYEPIDVLSLAMIGRMGVILVTEDDRIVGVAVTEVRQYPRCRVLEVPFVAGNGLKRWHQKLLDFIDAAAVGAECSDIMGFFRKGWVKFGFELDGVIVRRRVGGKR
jgi:hypothetical protein